jgi:nucleotide-binding universal stress UspA family protein
LVLAPVDGSEASTDAARYAVAVAAEYDARVHAVYVLAETTTEALETGRVEPTSVRSETATYVADLTSIATGAGVPLDASMAYGFSTSVKTRHPGSVVLDVAETTEADFVVVPREPESGGILERAAEYVLLYASQPVLSV